MLKHLFAIVVLACMAPSAALAQFVYTFEAPNFLLNQMTPILNAAPNVGSPTFRTDFTSAPNPTGFVIANFQPNI